jgi:hypothetical protein
VNDYCQYRRPFEYFLIQVLFAEKISRITGKGFDDCLFNYTVIYRVLYDIPKNDKPNLAWRILIFRLNTLNSVDKAKLIFKYFSKDKNYFINSSDVEPENKMFGFFKYEFKPKHNSIFLHFGNPDRRLRPLSDEHINERKSELKMLIEDVKNKYPQATLIETKSWLLSYPVFRNLFPEEFIRNIKPSELSFVGDGVWGQFIAYNGFIKKDFMDKFIDNINNSTTLEEIFNSFTFKSYEANCNIKYFLSYPPN